MLGVTFADPWRFEANPEVYLLVVFLVGRVRVRGESRSGREPSPTG